MICQEFQRPSDVTDGEQEVMQPRNILDKSAAWYHALKRCLKKEWRCLAHLDAILKSISPKMFTCTLRCFATIKLVLHVELQTILEAFLTLKKTALYLVFVR